MIFVSLVFKHVCYTCVQMHSKGKEMYMYCSLQIGATPMPWHRQRRLWSVVVQYGEEGANWQGPPSLFFSFLAIIIKTCHFEKFYWMQKKKCTSLCFCMLVCVSFHSQARPVLQLSLGKRLPVGVELPHLQQSSRNQTHHKHLQLQLELLVLPY